MVQATQEVYLVTFLSPTQRGQRASALPGNTFIQTACSPPQSIDLALTFSHSSNLSPLAKEGRFAKDNKTCVTYSKDYSERRVSEIFCAMTALLVYVDIYLLKYIRGT